MSTIDRGDFIQTQPYKDCPQKIGFNATISAPHMHCYALEWLVGHLNPGSNALDVGSGTGYLTLAMALMVGQDTPGVVVGIEHIPELVSDSVRNIRTNWAHLLDSGKIHMVAGDGRAGYPSHAPYSAIHVGAAAPSIPEDLI